MRRSICYCEPTSALAGDTATWKFIYTPAANLPKGARLRFDLQSKGRPIDWQIPQTNLKEKENLIWAELPDGKMIGASEVDHPQTLTTCFEFVLPQELKAGENVAICIGSPLKEPKKGTTSQKFIQRRRPFILSIDPKGKGDYKEAETFHLDVKGNALKTLRIIAPSLVNRNKRFDVIVRFEDVYGNLTSNAPEGTLIDLSYEHLRENLNWKLFVPETGFIALPNLYFNEPGIYKIQLRNTKSKEHFLSPPIKCLPEGALSLFWGNLHVESERIDSGENIESFLRHIRDDRALQFFASSNFESEEETSNESWKLISQQTAEFNEDDRFVAILGFQWQGETKTEGLRHFLYTKDSRPILRRKDTKYNSLKKIYKTSNPKEFLSIPSFTMGKQTCFDFEDHNPDFERVVEIYNAWGSSECTAKEGNPRPISPGSKGGGAAEAAEGSIRKALAKGCRFGFIAGGYDDRGPFADLFDANQAQYSPGLTAILAKEHNRSSLIEALHSRSCYATTGEKIILGFSIAGFGMGSEVDTKTRPGLEYNRHITGYAIGTAPLKEVLLIRNGKVLRSIDVSDEKVEFAIDDMDPLSSIAIDENPDRSPFVYYYLRAMQQDGHIAWSSPIWIDQTSSASPNQGGQKRAPKKKSA